METSPEAIAAALAGWLRQGWPDKPALAVKDVRPPIQEFSNETWLLDLEWGADDARERLPAVLRLQPAEVALFPTYDLSFQYRCMERLAGSGIPVPRLFGYAEGSEVGNPFGRSFYVMERMPGGAPGENPPYHLAGWLHDLPPARRRAVWLNGVEMMARVNRLDWTALGLGFLDQPSAGVSPLDRQLRDSRAFLAWAESLAEPYPLLRAALDWLETNRPQGGPVALCWGDPKLGNCLFDPEDDRCTGLLDWESAHLGNPVDDLAWLIVLDRSLCEGYGFPRLEGLPGRDETTAHWERCSGQTAHDLPYYEVFCAFKFALIMARIGCLFMARGLVPAGQRMDLDNGGSATLRLIAAEQRLPFAERGRGC